MYPKGEPIYPIDIPKELQRARAENNDLKQTIRMVEWDINGYCVWNCGHFEGEGRGHADDCRRQRALGIE